MRKLIKIGFDYLITPIISGALFFISCLLVVSMIMAPIVLYLATSDGLWNHERTLIVAMGLPALTLLIFNIFRARDNIFFQVWRGYFSINLASISEKHTT